MSVTVTQGSILDFEGDCIVNPANSFLQHGGGLARLINEGALHQGEHVEDFDRRVALWNMEHLKAPNIATGDAYMTSAGALPYKGVIHAVGPIWAGGQLHEAELLTSCHLKAFKLAYDEGFKSIAVPAISCGIFGFPVDQAAPIALDAASWFSHLLDITFVLFSDEDFDAYAKVARLYNVKLYDRRVEDAL